MLHAAPRPLLASAVDNLGRPGDRVVRRTMRVPLPRAVRPLPRWRGDVVAFLLGLVGFAYWHTKLSLELMRSDLARAFLRAFPGMADDVVGPWVLEAAGTWTFTNATRTDLLNGTYDLDTDSFKIALFLSTSNIGAATTTYAGVTNEHANGNGYLTGGVAVTISLSGTTTVTVDSSDASWTASGGSIVAHFAALYEVGGRVLCYCLLDSTPADVTVTDGNTLTVQINASGVFTLA